VLPLINAATLALLILAAVLSLLDWQMGKEKRAEMKAQLQNWWKQVSASSFLVLLADDAQKIRSVFQRILGAKWYGFRFIALSFLGSAVITSGFLIVSFLLFASDSSATFLAGYGPYFLFFIPTNSLFDWLSVAVALYFFKLMEQSQSLSWLGFLTLLDIAASIALAVAVLFVATAVGWPFEYLLLVDAAIEPQLNVERSFKWAVAAWLNLSYLMKHFAAGLTLADAAILVILFTSSIPILCHLVLAIGFILSKIFQPILRPVINRMVFAFCDSDKGVPSQIAVGLTVFAGILQAGARLL
jgi:hypothetical protein